MMIKNQRTNNHERFKKARIEQIILALIRVILQMTESQDKILSGKERKHNGIFERVR